MSPAQGPAHGPDAVARAGNALLAGNFAIGCGVMVVAGSLNDLVRSLQVSVPVGGQLITVAAVSMAVAAPILAGVLGTIDRRLLLTLAQRRNVACAADAHPPS